MGYLMTIHYDNLKLPGGKQNALERALAEAETYIDWHSSDGHVDPANHTFDWDEDFIEDLKLLRSAGVRGHIVVCGEEGEHEKYVLDDASVKKFTGIIAYSEEKYVDTPYFLTKIDAILNYFDITTSEPPRTIGFHPPNS